MAVFHCVGCFSLATGLVPWSSGRLPTCSFVDVLAISAHSSVAVLGTLAGHRLVLHQRVFIWFNQSINQSIASEPT